MGSCQVIRAQVQTAGWCWKPFVKTHIREGGGKNDVPS